MNPIDYALFYASKGWKVFPIPARQKTPFPSSVLADSRGNGGFAVATNDNTVIRHWWTRWPDANIGIATGTVSGIVVLDVDSRHGGEESLMQLKIDYGSDWAQTVQSVTGGGGRHLIFAHPGVEVRNSAGKLGPGLDIRGDGGYIVAPPSIHPSGTGYLWDNTLRPSVTPLMSMPGWLVNLCNGTKPNQEGQTAHAAQAIAERVTEGGRNQVLASLAGSMRRRGMGYDAILSSLLIENAQKCNPPLSADEVVRVAKSVTRYEPTAPPTGKPIEKVESIELREPMTAVRIGDAFIELLDNLAGRSVPTFIEPIDQSLGGLERQSLTVLAARPSMGKTTLAWQIARCVAINNLKVLFLSQEMSAVSLWAKAVCGSLAIRWKDIRAAGGVDAEQRALLVNRTNEMRDRYGANLLLDDGPQSMDTMAKLIDQLRPDLVVHDHLRLVNHKADNEVHRLGQVSGAMKQLAKQYNCAWLELAQLSRATEQRDNKRPTLSDLRDSGEIEENADVVLMMYRENYYDDGKQQAAFAAAPETELLVRKFRDDVKDTKIRLIFHSQFQWFSAIGQGAEY